MIRPKRVQHRNEHQPALAVRPRQPQTLRAADRAGLVTGRRMYEGALTNRLTGAWSAFRTSANEELRGALSTLRNRCRDRERNDPWFVQILAKQVSQVVGPKGCQLQAKATTPRGKPAQRTRSEIETRWHEWGRTATTCKKSLWQAVCLLFRSALRDGDAFAVMRIGENGVRLQLLESDYCDETFTADLSNGNKVVQGVEVTPLGEIVAYYFFRKHPGDGVPGERVRVVAGDVLHLANLDRIGQVRGAPLLVSALGKLHTLSKYEEAELEAARNGACVGPYFTKQAPEGWDGQPVDGDTGAIGVITEPGMGIELPYGVQVQQYTSSHPHTNFPPFIAQNLRAVAAAAGIPYHTLSGDMTSVNYSSARIAYLEAQAIWMCWQELLISHIYDPLFARFCDVETAAGRLRLARPESRAHTWGPNRWRWVDPEKDARGAALMLGNRLASPQEIISAAGRDPDEVLSEWAAWEEMLATRGITGGPETSAGNTVALEPMPGTEADSDDVDGEPDAIPADESNATN